MTYISEKLHNQLTATTCTFHGMQDPIRRNQMHSGKTEWPSITFKLDGITEDDIIKAHIRTGNDDINKTIMEPSVLAYLVPTQRPTNAWSFNDNTLDNQVLYYVSGDTGVKIGITTKYRLDSKKAEHNRLAHMKLTFNDPTLHYLAVVDIKATTGEKAFYVENQIKWDMVKSGFSSLAIKNRQGAKNTEIFGAEHHPKLWSAFVTKFKGYKMNFKSEMETFNEIANNWSLDEVQKALDNYGKNKRFDNKSK
jgi:hypothetical protein